MNIVIQTSAAHATLSAHTGQAGYIMHAEQVRQLADALTRAADHLEGKVAVKESA